MSLFVLFSSLVDVIVTQNTGLCQNESSLSIGERSQFEYQSNESHGQDEGLLNVLSTV